MSELKFVFCFVFRSDKETVVPIKMLQRRFIEAEQVKFVICNLLSALQRH